MSESLWTSLFRLLRVTGQPGFQGRVPGRRGRGGGGWPAQLEVQQDHRVGSPAGLAPGCAFHPRVARPSHRPVGHTGPRSTPALCKAGNWGGGWDAGQPSQAAGLGLRSWSPSGGGIGWGERSEDLDQSLPRPWSFWERVFLRGRMPCLPTWLALSWGDSLAWCSGHVMGCMFVPPSSELRLQPPVWGCLEGVAFGR